jgi:hypothetical protein
MHILKVSSRRRAERGPESRYKAGWRLVADRVNRGPRRAYTTASSAAALDHLGAADKRGSGAKTARNRCTDLYSRSAVGAKRYDLNGVLDPSHG